MSPIEMVDAGIRALRKAETHMLSHEAAAQTAMAWAALAEASVRVSQTGHEHKWVDASTWDDRSRGINRSVCAMPGCGFSLEEPM